MFLKIAGMSFVAEEILKGAEEEIFHERKRLPNSIFSFPVSSQTPFPSLFPISYRPKNLTQSQPIREINH